MRSSNQNDNFVAQRDEGQGNIAFVGIYKARCIPAFKAKLLITTRKCIQTTFILINHLAHFLVLAISAIKY